jgi:hypothetical protein
MTILSPKAFSKKSALQHTTHLVDFSSIDKGYEDFVQELRRLGFKWQDYRNHGGLVYAVLALSKTKVTKVLLGDFPASTKCDNGAPLCEFAVAASFFTIIEESMRYLEESFERKCCVPMMGLTNGALTIVVMAP